MLQQDSEKLFNKQYERWFLFEKMSSLQDRYSLNGINI